MNILPEHAEDGKNHPTANNNAASAEGVFDESTPDRSGKKNPIHGFSKAVAETKLTDGRCLGYRSALLLRYLAFKCRDHGAKIDGKKWVRLNLDYIASRFPYLGRSTVDECIQRLEAMGACEAKNLNTLFDRPKYDRTRSYHVPRQWMDAAEKEIRYFDSCLAAEIGIPAATIYYNFMHWIGVCAEKETDECVQLLPSTLETLLPFDKSTIKRAIQTLKQRGMLMPVQGKQCWYANNVSGSKADETGSNPDKGGSKADESGSKADNDSYYSNLNRSLEENSKSQAAPDSNEYCSCDKKQMLDEVISLEQTESLCPFETLVSSTSVSLAKGHLLIADFQQLHSINKDNSGLINSLAEDNDIRDQFWFEAKRLMAAFFKTVESSLLDRLYDEATDEEIFSALLPLYEDWAGKTFRSPEAKFYKALYYGIFECVLGAFYRGRHGEKDLHPIVPFISAAYEAYLDLFRRAEKRRLKDIEEEDQQLKIVHASPDEEDEWRDDIAPAHKVRVFKQALHSRNKIGWICLGGVRQTDQIKISKKGLKDVEQLFRLNPAASPGDLLMVMDACMELHSTYPSVPKEFRKGIKWHARKGHVLWMFTRHLQTIIRQVNLQDLPFNQFLGEPLNSAAEEGRELFDVQCALFS